MIDRLSPDGLYRWREFQHLVPVSRETWRKRVLAGRAPKPEKLGERCTYWRGQELLEWLKDPDGYRVNQPAARSKGKIFAPVASLSR